MSEKYTNAKAHIFSKNSSIHAIFNNHSFNGKLTNNIVSFEQLGPVFLGLTVQILRLNAKT